MKIIKYPVDLKQRYRGRGNECMIKIPYAITEKSKLY